MPASAAVRSHAGIAVLLLVHEPGCPNAAVFEAWQQACSPGLVALYVHMRASARKTMQQGVTPGYAFMRDHMLSTAVEAEWGAASLVQASGVIQFGKWQYLCTKLSCAEQALQAVHAIHVTLGTTHNALIKHQRAGQQFGFAFSHDPVEKGYV